MATAAPIPRQARRNSFGTGAWSRSSSAQRLGVHLRAAVRGRPSGATPCWTVASPPPREQAWSVPSLSRATIGAGEYQSSTTGRESIKSGTPLGNSMSAIVFQPCGISASGFPHCWVTADMTAWVGTASCGRPLGHANPNSFPMGRSAYENIRNSTRPFTEGVDPRPSLTSASARGETMPMIMSRRCSTGTLSSEIIGDPSNVPRNPRAGPARALRKHGP